MHIDSDGKKPIAEACGSMDPRASDEVAGGHRPGEVCRNVQANDRPGESC